MKGSTEVRSCENPNCPHGRAFRSTCPWAKFCCEGCSSAAHCARWYAKHKDEANARRRAAYRANHEAELARGRANKIIERRKAALRVAMGVMRSVPLGGAGVS